MTDRARPRPTAPRAQSKTIRTTAPPRPGFSRARSQSWMEPQTTPHHKSPTGRGQPTHQGAR